MRSLCLLSVLCGSMAWAQAKPAANKPADAKPASPVATAVAPDTPVLTIKGLCSSPKVTSSTSQPCETIVTREQFEKLVEAIQPTVDEHSKRQIARAYPEFLVMAHEAEQRGLEKTTRFEERLGFARLQILSQELVRQIQEQAAQVPEKDVEDYYQKNSRDFETADLQRIVIPPRGEKDELPPQAINKEAEALRARAAAGEDFTKLQKAAYEAAGVSGNTEPDPNLRNMRRRGLPPTHASVFDLKPGEVSAVISDATGFYIYKMESKGMVPLQTAHREIWNVLRQERARKMIESVQQPFTTEVNHAYFGPDKDGDKN